MPEYVVRLVGVYDAEGSLRGELSYWIGARFGTRHCALCEITHGLVRSRREWRARRSELAVPFDTFHLDDQPVKVRDAAMGRAPVVIAETSQRMVLLAGPEELERCGGSVDALIDLVDAAVEQHGLRWPG